MPGKRARPVRREAARKRTSPGWHLAARSTPPEFGKGLAGLDEHQVRTWTSWHRWVTLAMLAAAMLAIAAAAERRRDPPPEGQIPLTRNEIATLFAHLIIKPPGGARYRLRWSTWRRHHQYQAQQCHYQRQAAQSP